MKKCPHCKYELTFLEFVSRYGSDTLIQHPPQGHKREHLCKNCHAKLWIHYHRDVFMHFLKLDTLRVFLSACVVSWLMLRPVWGFSHGQSFLMAVVLSLMTMPILLAYAKYKSGVLGEEL